MSASLSDATWPLHTERLLLRPVTREDLLALWGYRRLPEVSRWLGGVHDDEASFLAGSEAMLTRNLAVEREGQIIGDLMVVVEDGWAQRGMEDLARATQAELGWTFSPDAGGRGYATEAVRAVIDVCFRVLGLRRVHAGCFAANQPSWRLMERIGMRREEHSRRTGLHRSGEWMDGMDYGLLAEEWPLP